MNEFVELISSISVLIASFAGLSAVNKWKRERFDKAKIESIEEYESCLREVAHELNETLEQPEIYFYLREGDHENTVLEQMHLFLEIKNKSVSELSEKINKADDVLNVFSGYAGSKLSFVNNYYKTSVLLMKFSMLSFELDVKSLNNPEERYLDRKGGYFLFPFLSRETPNFDFINYMMLSSILSLFVYEEYDEDVFLDRRERFDDVFLKIVSYEKMALHSGFLKNLFLKVKILIMKYNLVGRVLYITDKHAIVVGLSGVIYKHDTQGYGCKFVEEKKRKRVFLKLVKSEFINIFS